MYYTEFTESEYEEIHNTKGYYSQNGWGQEVWVNQDSARSEKLREIRARHELHKIGDKAREFGCGFELTQSMDSPGIIKISCPEETTPGGFDKFVEWYRKEILGVAYILEVT